MTPDPFDAALAGRPVSDADLARLKQTPTPARLPRPGKREQYLGGPIPMGWLGRAAALPGKALHLAVALWFEAGRRPGKPAAVGLSERTYRRFGLTARNTRARALRALAGAGLVRVEVRVGRPTVVTVLAAPPEAAEGVADG